MGATQDAGLELARVALELQREANGLKEKLDAAKEELRDFANGQKLNLVVEGVGKVDITAPREGSEKMVLTIDEERVGQVEGLKEMLITKGVAKEEIKKTSPASASVRIKPNV